MIPLPKTNDLSEPNNFRPISILPLLSKPIERHIHKHLLNFLTEHNLLCQSQSGFRPQHSCHTALAKLCDNWLSAINNSEVVGAVFLDLKKAFDLVNHNILLKKLSLYTANSPFVSLFKSYLELRSQSVYVNGEYSNEGIVRCGIPQGSILGPLLFSIFINDLPLHITSNKVNCDMFADDTSLNTSDKDTDTVQNELQRSINEASDWCDNNAMILHPAKTKSMLLTTRQKHQLRPLHLNLSLKDSHIEQVHEHRHLGVIIDDEFSWRPHIIGTCKTVSKNLYLLSQLRHFVDTPKRKLFYHAHISSHLTTYASTV